MKVTQEKLSDSRVGLEIQITPEMSQQAYDKTLQNLTRNANIPGFRKGKVPRQVILQRFGSRQVKAMALEELIENSLKQAVEQEKIDALGNFDLRSPFEDLVSQFEPGTEITVSAAVDVPPSPTLNQYKGLTVQAEEVTYDAAKVDQVIEQQRERVATRVPVEGRPSKEGDVAVIDFKGVLAKEDPDSEEEPQEIPGGSAQDFEVELLEDRFIPGFISGIIGMNVGETKEIQATFPDPYAQEDLAGKAALFTVTLKDLKEKELPELDDDFAQEVSEFETFAELRESLETRYQKEAEEKTKANKQEALLAELVKHVEVELPDTLVRREVDYMITQLAMQFSNQGTDIKKLFTSEVVANLRQSSRSEAISRLKRTLTLGEIAKLEDIKIEDEAVAARTQEVLAEVGNDVDPDRVRQVVEEDLLKDKIFEWLEANNTVELVPEGTLKTEETPEEDISAEDTSEVTAEAAVDTEPAPAVEQPAADAVVEVAAETVTDAPETAAADTPADAAEPAAETPAKASRKKSTTKKSTAKKSDGEGKAGSSDDA